jgi:hypothetical protein
MSRASLLAFIAAAILPVLVDAEIRPAVLKADDFKHYIDEFNATDTEPYRQTYPNNAAWDFIRRNAPLFNCPDADFQRTWYFRWWTYRKHVLRTPDGFVVTEFMPKVPWAGKYNTIGAAAFQQVGDGRWLADDSIVRDYLEVLLTKGGSPRTYTFPAAATVWAVYLARGDRDWTVKLLPALVANYREWEKTHRDANGLFWQTDTADGMEISAGGHGYRPTINACMYGDARAIADIARLAGDNATAAAFDADADKIRGLVETRLWSDKTHFFHTVSIKVDARPRPEQPVVDPSTRELMGYEPWLFDLPTPGRGYEVAWQQIKDPQGFAAPFGPTTAEQRSPLFRISYEGHECQWNGPSWPFATSLTLDAMANVIRDYPQHEIDRADYFELLKTYTRSQRITLSDGRVVPWIDEDLDPDKGNWIARDRLIELAKNPANRAGPAARGQDYNHSSYNDLIITGLCGLVPGAGNQLVVHPLLPDRTWDWFCLDGVPYHGHSVTIVWDRDGKHFGRGVGLSVWVDGKPAGRSDHLSAVQIAVQP